MNDSPDMARIAALIGDPARAAVLAALLAERALTATELAEIAGVTKQTMKSHLARPVDARLACVEQQGCTAIFGSPTRTSRHCSSR